MIEGAVLERPASRGDPGADTPGVQHRRRQVSQRYLLVTMGGPASRAAAAWLGAACRGHASAGVTLLYVLMPIFRYPMAFEDSPGGYAEPLDVALAHESRLAFDEARAELGLPAEAVREAAVLGCVEPTVLRVAESGDYRAVVIGRGHSSGLAALLRPGPIGGLWRRLSCPLVVVPAEA